MNFTLKKRVATAIATGAVLLYALTPMVSAATTIEISGNGSSSDNDANVSMSQTTTVVQSNNADITNNVTANSNTGNNDANRNTGGDTSVNTGDASTTVNATNTANTNVANVNCCNTGDTTVKISGNGTKSDNTANLTTDRSTKVFQDNNANINNNIHASSDTGNNDAKDNTGGDVSIKTGDADTSVSVTNKANANAATVGGNGGGGGSVNLWITGNGSDSDNDITLGLSSDVLLVQSNNAKIKNYINASADTGDNDAKDNTGGDVVIDTGDADTDVDVDNTVNFNVADINCDCLIDGVTAKVAGNGKDSDNTIKAKLDASQKVFQDNCGHDGIWVESPIDGHGKCALDNTVHADSDTGDNNGKDNTGVPQDGVSVETGDADSDTDISNSGNVNVFGRDTNVELPTFDFGLNITLDLSDLLNLLHS